MCRVGTISRKLRCRGESSKHPGWRDSLMEKVVSASASAAIPSYGPLGAGKILPAFQGYQHRDHRDVLEDLLAFFGCGTHPSQGP